MNGTLHPAETPSISAMEPWAFWTAPRAVGSTYEEVVAGMRGEVPEARMAELREKTAKACLALRKVEPAGFKWHLPLFKVQN
jgi:hypothetical protein